MPSSAKAVIKESWKAAQLYCDQGTLPCLHPLVKKNYQTKVPHLRRWRFLQSVLGTTPGTSSRKPGHLGHYCKCHDQNVLSLRVEKKKHGVA